MSNKRTVILAALSLLVAHRPLRAGETPSARSPSQPAFADLVQDNGLHSAINTFKERCTTFHSAPNDSSLQAVYLASRDLKSQLNRCSRYLGAAVLDDMKIELLPALSTGAEMLKANSNLAPNKTKLALTNIDACQKMVIGERSH